MAQYIDKDALVAEIEERIKAVSQIEKASYEIGLCDAYKTIISFIDTLEVKDVDLATHGKELIYAIQKTGERTKREVIEKACEYLSETLMGNHDNCGYDVVSSFDTITLSEYIEDFKNTMEK